VREWPESLAMLDQTQPDMFHKLALDEDMHQGLPEENVCFSAYVINLSHVMNDWLVGRSIK